MRTVKSILSKALSLVSGGSTTLFKLLWEILQAIMSQITWTVVLERFLTRLLVGTLKWLKELSSNQLVDETIEDILDGLRQKGLREARI